MNLPELLTRGIEKIYPSTEEAQKMLENGRPLRIYLGIDPTGTELHLGHSVPLLFLRRLLDAGHRPVILMGDFTARIGDPTDKEAARKQLTPEEVNKNLATYKDQIGKILPIDKIEWRFNSEWLEPLTLQRFEEIKSTVTVQQLMARDMFQKRIADSKPIYANELDYPILQGYDSVALDTDGEVGGNDQTFNMLVGRDMLKHYKNREKIVIAIKLLADPATGKKMSKTEGTLVALNETPQNMFGGVMAFSDGMIMPAFEMITDVPMERVHEAGERLAKGENPMTLKMELAGEITRMYHGGKAALESKEEFLRVFSKGEVPEQMPEHKPGVLVDILVSSGLVQSKAEARRLISQKAVKINDKAVMPSADRLVLKPGDIVKIGSRRFLKII